LNKGDKRATPAEIEQRITAILPYVIAGKTAEEICRIMSLEKDIDWDISVRQMQRYMRFTDDWLEQFADINKRKEIGKIRFRLEHIFREALAGKDLNQARLVLRDYCELFGLNAPSKMESDTKLEIIIRDAWKQED